MALGQVGLETGAAAQASSLADRLEGFKRQSINQVSMASAEQGKQQALQDAKDNEGEFRANFGVSSKAYNQTLATAYKASFKSDLSEGLSALAAEHPNDIQTFNDLSQELIKSSVQNADPVIANELALDADLIASQYRKQVHGNTIKTNLEAANQAYQNSALSLENEMLRGVELARSPEEVESAALQLNGLYQQLEERVAGGSITQEVADVEKMRLAKGFAEQSFMNQIDDSLDISPEAALAKIEELQPTPNGWNPIEWNAFLGKAATKVNRELSSRSAKGRANLKRLEQDVKTHRQMTVNGEVVDSAAQNKLIVETSQIPELSQYVSDSIALGSFSVQDAQSRSTEIQETNDGSFEGYRDSQRLAQQNELVTDKYKANGYEFGVKQGMIEAIPLNSENGFLNRGEQARELSIHSGVEVSPVTNAELSMLSTEINEGSYQDQISLINSINTMQFGKEKLYGQLAGKNNNVFAVVGMAGDEGLAMDALMGLDKIKNGLISKPKTGDYQSVFNDYMGNALGANDSAATLETAIAVYANAYGSDDFDSGNFESVLDRIVGGVGTKGDRQYILPKYDGLTISESDFETNMYYFNEAGYESLGGASGYSFNEFKEALDDGELIGVGQNQYYIKDNVTGGLIMSAQDSSKPFIYSYNPEWRDYTPSVNPREAITEGYRYVP